MIEDVELRDADRRAATRCGSPRRSRGSAAAPRTRARSRSTRRPCSPAGAREAPRRGRTRTPTRPGGSPAGSSSGSTGWASGAATTPTSRTSRAASPATTARSRRRWGRRCSTAGLLAEKPSVGQRHVFLNPRRAADIRRLIDTGDAPRGSARRRGVRYPPHDARRPTQVADKLQTLVTLAEAGIVRPQRPDRAARTPCARWSASAPRPAAGYRAAAARYPDEPAVIDELGTLTFRRSTSGPTRSRTRCARDGSARATASRSCAATTAAGSSRRRLLEARRPRAVPQHRVLRAAARRRGQAREAEGDHLRPGVRRGARDAGQRRKRYIAWHEPGDGRPRTRCSRT